MDDDIPYLLLTPGPLSTTKTVKQAMLQDYCTWDDDYNSIVTDIRSRLVRLATATDEFTSVLMQGSGTFSVEATLGSVVPESGCVLVVNNGAYGSRMGQICKRLRIDSIVIDQPEDQPADLARIKSELASGKVTHVAMVHCETTTGLTNPVNEVGQIARDFNAIFIVDAMSSFGGMAMSMEEMHADFLISSANKCIQGVPGFGFVIARRSVLEECEGRARSLSLDLYDQWNEMEFGNGKWRYTSPTHVVRAFLQALIEFDQEGANNRHRRYDENQRTLSEGMSQLGFRTLIESQYQSPIITAFRYPIDERFEFLAFYNELKKRRFVIYPGKVSQAPTFRIGTIGNVVPDDIRALVSHVREVVNAFDWRVS